MIVCVQGLWHLGSVTAACLANAGHTVIGLDHDAATIAKLRESIPPVDEPGLADLLRAVAIDERGGRAPVGGGGEGPGETARASRGALELTTDVAAAARADVLWVTYDTPVDADDRADVDFVVEKVRAVLPHLREGAVVIVSSQLPVGTTARLEREAPKLHFACSPENLRLGKAIEVFTNPDRIVVGIRDDAARTPIAALLAPITERIEWMSIESAEMTKHAINAFLAVSVTFANELAAVCERVGADAKQVERGLKTEARIGPKAYLAPGGAFAGGTLARDVAFLGALGEQHALALPLLGGVRPSNEAHKKWAQRRLGELFSAPLRGTTRGDAGTLDRLGSLAGKRIAVWGLTYKPGTDTLRRSAAVELCLDLAAAGAEVVAFDPAVTWVALARELDARAHPGSAGSFGAGRAGELDSDARTASNGSFGAGRAELDAHAPNAGRAGGLDARDLDVDQAGDAHAPNAGLAGGLDARDSDVDQAGDAHGPNAGRIGKHARWTSPAIILAASAEAALDGAWALVVATEWPAFKAIDLAALLPRMARPVVVDANRFLVSVPGAEYYAVGVP